MPVDVRQLGTLVSSADPSVTMEPNSVLRHVRVSHPSNSDQRSASETQRLNELVECLVDATAQRFHERQNAHASSADNGWSAAVPKVLRNDLEKSVEYLCMLVAIDFRHWDELDASSLAQVGDVVQQKNFWAVVHDDTAPHREAGKPSIVRGSAAMVYLLREAVDTHGLHWYDASTLLTSLVDRSTRAPSAQLLKMFEGVEEDGVTAMMMPAVAERVEILVSMAETKVARGGRGGDHIKFETFHELMVNHSMALFSDPTAGVDKGFLDALIDLHPRYLDANTLTCADGRSCYIYFLKLAQLTVIAIEAAFPERISFKDSARLCVCSDYQLPKALRVSGLISYDRQLASSVDSRVLLGSGSVEEVEIRVASTIAAAQLMEWANTSYLPYLEDNEAALASTRHVRGARVDISSLDYALWFYGRSFKDQPHHLCRTVMY
jgi:hypothetical protein